MLTWSRGASPRRRVQVGPDLAFAIGTVATVTLMAAVITVGASGSWQLLAGLTALAACALAFSLAAVVRPTAAWVTAGTVAFLFTRPNTVGEAFGFLGTLAWIAVAVSARSWMTERVSIRFLVSAGVLLGSYWFYILLLDQYRTNTPASNQLGTYAIPSLLAGAGALIGGWALIRERGRSDLFLKTLVALLTWQVAAYALMLPVWRALGSSAGVLAVGDLSSFGGREQTFTVWFSGAITTGSGGFAQESLGPRLTGWAGEPGVLAATMVVMALQTGLPRRWRLVMGVTAILGVLFTQSTAGVLAGAIAGLVWLLLRATRPLTRILSAVGVLTLGFAAFGWLLSSQFGLKGKGESNAISVDDRLSGAASLPHLIQAWATHPLGDPFARAGSVGINVIQESLRYGVLVALLSSAVLVVPALMSGSFRKSAPGVAALLATIWFAQPGMTNPLWLMLLAVVVGTAVQKQTLQDLEIQSMTVPPEFLAAKRTREDRP